MLIAAGANVNSEDRIRSRPIELALDRDDMAVTELLLESGADVLYPGLLRYSVNWGSPEALALLLNAGANPSIDIGGLHAAGRNNDIVALEALLTAGADINARHSYGETPIFTALPNAQPSIIRRMIEVGADPTIPDTRGLYPLHRAMGGAIGENIALVVAAGADPNRKDHRGNTPLHIVAAEDVPGNAIALVAAGAELEMLDNDGATPLLVALKAGSMATATTLIELGADTSATGYLRRGILFYAASSEDPDLIETVLTITPRIDPRDKGGATPLMLTAAAGPPELIRMLIDAGADVKATDTYGSTPLHYAARYADGEIVRLMIALGANPRAIDSEGRIPQVLGFNNRALRADPVAFNLLDE